MKIRTNWHPFPFMNPFAKELRQKEELLEGPIVYTDSLIRHSKEDYARIGNHPKSYQEAPIGRMEFKERHTSLRQE